MVDWSLAVCAQTDPDAFTPDPGDPVWMAKQVCAECPIREECLAYAVERREPSGVWGGLSARERKKLWRSAA